MATVDKAPVSERDRKIAALQAAIEKQRAMRDQPSCVETAMWRELDALTETKSDGDGLSG